MWKRCGRGWWVARVAPGVELWRLLEPEGWVTWLVEGGVPRQVCTGHVAQVQ